ncbi:Hypothetical predicted protein [Cloeon dipterum]|nr:Hypothetical predicted protein [Cloeon dipterum]
MDGTPNYDFRYAAQDAMTGNYQVQEEHCEDGKVSGTYSMSDPNGDLRVITYVSDKRGNFQSEVRIEPGGAVLTPDKRTFEGFFSHLNSLASKPFFTGKPPEVGNSPVAVRPVFSTYDPTQAGYHPGKEPKRPEPTVGFRPEDIPKRSSTSPPQLVQHHDGIITASPAIQQPVRRPFSPQPTNPTTMHMKTSPPSTASTPMVITPSAVVANMAKNPYLTARQPQIPYMHQPQQPVSYLPPLKPSQQPFTNFNPMPLVKTQPQQMAPPAGFNPTTHQPIKTEFQQPQFVQEAKQPSQYPQNQAQFTPTYQPQFVQEAKQPSYPQSFTQFTPSYQGLHSPFQPQPQQQQQQQQTFWNPYDAAALGGTPYMLVRTYMVPIQPTSVVPTTLLLSKPPTRVVQQPESPQPTVQTNGTPENDAPATEAPIEEKEVTTAAAKK